MLVLAGFSVAASKEQHERQALYRDDRFGFSIVPPLFEKSQEAPVALIAMFNAPAKDGFSANLNIVEQKADWKTFTAQSESQFATLQVKDLAQNELKVDEHKAREYRYKSKQQGKDFLFVQLAVDNGDHVFLLTGTFPEKDAKRYEPVLREAISTFHLRK